MKPLKLNVLTLGILATFGLAACNSGDSNSAKVDPTVTSSNKVTSGVITGFGSVFVNGVEYETDNSSVEVDGVSSSEDQLAVGMVVTVSGSVNTDGKTGTAASIKYEKELEGAILANNLATDGTGTLDVMGQTVVVDTNTLFESKLADVTQPTMLQQGQIVEISGYSSGDGTIYATRIELKSASHEQGKPMEVKGLISNLDSSASTFTIGNLTINYSGAQLENLPDGTLSNDMYVEVKSTDGLVDGILMASKIELAGDGQDSIDGEENEEIEVEGVVTEKTSDTEFKVNGQAVILDDQTDLEHGDMQTIMEGVRVEVEGQFNADGAIIAHNISFRQEAQVTMEGVVDAVDVDNNTITVMGQVITIDNLTTMKDDRDQNSQTPERYFSVSDIAAGDRVEVHAYTDADGKLIATKLQRDDNTDSSVKIEGMITDMPTVGQLLIAGVTVDVSAFTGITLNVGDKVEIKGTYDNGVLVANEVSLDDKSGNDLSTSTTADQSGGGTPSQP
jgi:hypothetical protein